MSQNKDIYQASQEFRAPKDIEIKFFRLHPPKLNTWKSPLSGLYNDIDNIEEDTENPLQNKFSSFELTPNSVNLENIFSLEPYFGRVFHKEKLEGLILFINTSEHDVLLKKLDVTLTIDEKHETKTKKQKRFFDISLPKDGVELKRKEVYSVKFSKVLDYASKYAIFIDLKVRSPVYDSQYIIAKQKNLVKDPRDESNDYIVIGDNIIEVSNYKRLTFDVNSPFKIIEKFHNYQMNTCYIEIKIINSSIYPLTLTDLYLTPKTKPDFKIIPVENLQELSKNQAQFLFEQNADNNIELDLSPSEYFSLQSEEETSVLFKISDPALFSIEEKYVLTIKWLNIFDVSEKLYIYEFSNTLNTFNDYYKITVSQKPEKNITKNENFKIVLKLETKNPNKKFTITLSQEALRDNDKSNDREIEIIDIIDKKIELNNKLPENFFILICKSDVLGNVYLPRLKFLLYEDNDTNPNGNVYDALLSFNNKKKKEL